ncbi:hypothetical protein H2198_004684 [Neophaeococcomyces mojaviensis]|uniref:Uncharacterized protein n=1 Tax=Neophaeococcomyces mojaviensis TaxID=3383035 RepID=A0ACC3A7S3_9EURO|nr:hypothetical protein H2198_004684 [Knufia sp. JES_112]
MTGELVLITGANGALGYPTVVHALKAGYRVRAVVRSQAKAERILNGPSIKALDDTTRANLSFAIVDDLLKPDAYDESLKDTTFVIHVASPIPGGGSLLTPEELEDAFVVPAIKGTINMLEAAERIPFVRRVIITSSVLAQVSISEIVGPVSDKVYNETSRTPDPSGPYQHDGVAYMASKILALNAAERWLKEKERRISIVHVHPAFTLGRVELATTREEILQGSSGVTLAYILNLGGPGATISNTIWVEDVAEMHIRALDEGRIKNGQSLVGSSDGLSGANWADGKKILQKRFPRAIETGAFPIDVWPEPKIMNFDATETERLLGMKFTGYERQIADVVEQYLEVTGAEVA